MPTKNALTVIRLIFLDVLFTQNYLLRDDAFETAGHAAVLLEPDIVGCLTCACRF
ncbi:MAG: hypothetical protein AAGA97_10460 [Pseudomonadota bacterium]